MEGERVRETHGEPIKKQGRVLIEEVDTLQVIFVYGPTRRLVWRSSWDQQHRRIPIEIMSPPVLQAAHSLDCNKLPYLFRVSSFECVDVSSVADFYRANLYQRRYPFYAPQYLKISELLRLSDRPKQDDGEKGSNMSITTSIAAPPPIVGSKRTMIARGWMDAADKELGVNASR